MVSQISQEVRRRVCTIQSTTCNPWTLEHYRECIFPLDGKASCSTVMKCGLPISLSNLAAIWASTRGILARLLQAAAKSVRVLAFDAGMRRMAHPAQEWQTVCFCNLPRIISHW
ncbi:unnamed protein product [Effrenium voratum]|uniref:Uncharacterized protein n=1 Tax=Effrenium voratum TaxID=2562239 RepID=A0AA36MKL7_9DINO|nr:unnamed protein product [Effrenium voratum]